MLNEDLLEYGNQKIKEQDVAHNEIARTQDVDQPVFLFTFQLGHHVCHWCHGWVTIHRLETLFVRWGTKYIEINFHKIRIAGAIVYQFSNCDTVNYKWKNIPYCNLIKLLITVLKNT